MSNATDKVNARNLENLRVAIATVEMIPGFNPSNELISKTALVELERDFANLLETLHEKITAESNATVVQTEAFGSIGRMATRISSAAQAGGLSAEASLRLSRTVRLLRGRVRPADFVPEMAPVPSGIASASGIAAVAATPAAPNGNGDRGRVQAHTTKASMLSNLDVLHEQILSMPNYRPNEEDLTAARFGEWIAYLRQTRNTRLAARAATENARQERDDLLLGPDGLGVRMRMLKMYINSILDSRDERSSRIRGLKFVLR